MMGEDVDPVVREQWTVIDKWWTDEPVRREFREVELPSGERRVEWRDPRVTEAWEIVVP